MQNDKSPYGYAWNNPIILTDPDGNCPWCVGFIVGGLVEIGTQVTMNAITGKELTDIDWGDVGTSAVIGAVTSGASALATAGKVSVKTAKTIKKVAEATKEVTQAALDIKTNNGELDVDVVGGDKDVTDAAVEYGFGKAVGWGSSKVSNMAGDMLNSGTKKTLKQAERRVKQTANGSINNEAAKQVVSSTKRTIKGNTAVVKTVVNKSVSVATSDTKEKTKEIVNSTEELILD